MKKWTILLMTLLLCGIAACSSMGAQTNSRETGVSTGAETEASTDAREENPQKLSEMAIRVTSGNQSVVFQLYDTEAAQNLYDQLPLELELDNFRNAQWMFYPPKKLAVTDQEAYHDGKKGELSYYEPWGDAFMLYEDFYAGDEMHRLGICLEGIDNIAGMSGTVLIEKEDIMKITIGDTVFTATLADNSSVQALKELLSAGPLTIPMSDYGNMEKVGPIGQSLPENNEQITTGAGDIILYQGNSLVIYYDTNSWNFTRIGKINHVTQEELKAALGSGNVSVTFELGASTVHDAP